MTAAIGPRQLLAAPNYLRLWVAGGFGNSMRWLEMLVAGIYTFDLTGSAFSVAVVTVARTLPMLFLGSLTGVVSEALNRKTMLLCGLFIMAANSAVLCALAADDIIRVWHIALGGVVAGTVWTTEMAVRRRMIGEVMAPAHVGQAIALDSVTGSATRMIGPLLGGIAFQTVGLAGAYALSTAVYLAAGLIVIGLAYQQETRRLNLARIPADIIEGLVIVRQHPIILGVVLITIITNVFAFSYSALIAPIGLSDYAVSPVLVGLLAAAEPLGAIMSGLAMAAGWVRMDRPRMMVSGSFVFLFALVATALAPWYALAFVLLLTGGLGTAAFSSMQSTLVLTNAPAAARSRVLGIITVCIGTGPLGVLAVGALSDRLGASRAMLVMALTGIAALAVVRQISPAMRK
jgi:MFS family permease